MQTELALINLQLIKVCCGSRLHLFEEKENLTVGHQVWVKFAATISQLTTTKDSVQKWLDFSSKLVLRKSAVPSIHSSVSYSWMLHNASGFCLQLFLCNSLQIFIFHIYFLTADFFLPPSTLIGSFLTDTF